MDKLAALKALDKQLEEALRSGTVVEQQDLRKRIWHLRYASECVESQDSDGCDVGCHNVDTLDVMAPAWTSSHRPDIVISFLDPTNPDATPCRKGYRKTTLSQYIRSDTSDRRLWIPNFKNQMNGQDFDTLTGCGGHPSCVECYIKLPCDSTLILIDPSFVKDLAAGEYIGIPLYKVCYGNAQGQFGEGLVHGQLQDWLYVVVSTDELVRHQQLDRCLQRHLRVRVPYGMYSYKDLCDDRRRSIVDQIRMIVEKYPIPIMDLFRSQQLRRRFDFELHNRVSLLDAFNNCLHHLREYDSFMLHDPDPQLPDLIVTSYSHIWTADDKNLFVDYYIQTDLVSLPHDNDVYPEPLCSVAVLRQLLDKNSVLFRWDGILWRPTIIMGEPVDICSYRDDLLELTIEEQLIFESGQCPPRYRVVSSKSTDEQLQLLRFSMFPMLANKEIIQTYFQADLQIQMYLKEIMIRQGQYYLVHDREEGLHPISDDKGDTIEFLLQDPKVTDFLIAEHIHDTNYTVSKSRPVLCTEESYMNLDAARQMYWTNVYFRNRVASHFTQGHRMDQPTFQQHFTQHCQKYRYLARPIFNREEYVFCSCQKLHSLAMDIDDLEEGSVIYLNDDNSLAWSVYDSDVNFRRLLHQQMADSHLQDIMEIQLAHFLLDPMSKIELSVRVTEYKRWKTQYDQVNQDVAKLKQVSRTFVSHLTRPHIRSAMAGFEEVLHTATNTAKSMANNIGLQWKLYGYK